MKFNLVITKIFISVDLIVKYIKSSLYYDWCYRIKLHNVIRNLISQYRVMCCSHVLGYFWVSTQFAIFQNATFSKKDYYCWACNLIIVAWHCVAYQHFWSAVLMLGYCGFEKLNIVQTATLA